MKRIQIGQLEQIASQVEVASAQLQKSTGWQLIQFTAMTPEGKPASFAWDPEAREFVVSVGA